MYGGCLNLTKIIDVALWQWNAHHLVVAQTKVTDQERDQEIYMNDLLANIASSTFLIKGKYLLIFQLSTAVNTYYLFYILWLNE